MSVPGRAAAGFGRSGFSLGVRFVRMESGAAVYEVGSGVYSFRSKEWDRPRQTAAR